MSMTQPGHMQAAPSLMMTTSGLKSLDEIQEEQQINEDLRWGIFQVVCVLKKSVHQQYYAVAHVGALHLSRQSSSK